MHYLRSHSTMPVPEVYHYDANPYNRLGGEYILMSKVSDSGILGRLSCSTSSVGGWNSAIESFPLSAPQ